MRICVARQPIYDSDNNIYAYELLYRNGKLNAFPTGTDSKTATMSVLSDALISFGMGELTNGKAAFINFDKALIMSDVPDLLVDGNFVIEILETTQVDDFFIAHLEMWKEKGFKFALDDYIGGTNFERVMQNIDVVKVDFKLTTTAQQDAIARRLLPMGKRLLAEKIETAQQYAFAKQAGYSLFQGFYFGRPMMISTEMPSAQKITYSRIFREISGGDFEFRKLSRIIRNDINLSYKLLNVVNTMRFYRGHRINSVHTALVRMGEKEVRRWISLVFVRDSVAEGNDENVKTALSRGVFAELIAVMLNKQHIREDAFMVGMFSMIDIIMNNDLHTLLDNVCISANVRDALLGNEGELKDILDFVKNYEVGNWKDMLIFAKRNGLKIDKISHGYILTLRYVDGVFA